MATKNSIGLEFEGLEELTEQLEKLNGELPKVAEKALVESKKIVTVELVKATTKKNLPAKGKYSTGKTRHSIDTSREVEWQGTTASIPIGFDIDKSGLTSIFLMNGTPKMKPSAKIKNALFGSKIRKKVAETQREIFEKAIEKRLGK